MSLSDRAADKPAATPLTKGEKKDDDEANKSKFVHIFLNGEAKEPPKKLLIYRRNMRTFVSLMDSITEKLKPNFGCVKQIYSASTRHRIGSVSDFKLGHQYIVAGNEPLKLTDYPIKGYENYRFKESNPDKLLPHYTKKNFESVLPRFTKIPEKSSVVYFYRNGINFIEERKKIILKKWMLKDWNVLLSELTAIMPLVNGAIYSIYHASSLMPVKRLQEIDDNKCFVAVGRERFIKPLFYSSDIANESDESGINANLKADRESTVRIAKTMQPESETKKETTIGSLDDRKRKSSTNFLKGFNSTQREEEKSQPLQSSSSLMLNSSISSSTANLPSISDLQDRESGSIKSIKRMTSICQARPSNVTESSRND